MWFVCTKGKHACMSGSTNEKKEGFFSNQDRGTLLHNEVNVAECNVLHLGLRRQQRHWEGKK
jgi:hypothetical protein